jgi:hypothetical protein
MADRNKSYPKQALVVSEVELESYRSEMSEAQVNFLLQRTPRSEIKTRPGKGGGTWSYVEVGYVIDTLNKVFGFLWDFDVVDKWRDGNEVIVLGKLTVVTPNGREVSKKQFGGADVKMRQDSKGVVSISNDYKAAGSDALKKCASLLGIALDLYGRERLDDVPDDLGGGWERGGSGNGGAASNLTDVIDVTPERVRVEQRDVVPSSQKYYANKRTNAEPPPEPPEPTNELFAEAEHQELSKRVPGSDFEKFDKWASNKLRPMCADSLIDSLIEALLIQGDRQGTLGDTDWLRDISHDIAAMRKSSDAVQYLAKVQGDNAKATQAG